ncbi:outer membrane protein transport protein [Fulvivirgaceae bacterium BMA10]|uniref:Outer membrane protein transport protein n=1 Tax=Splendidivirga corallicola TaxID=3051826 RepID=A0ABT8KK67_9BACT|nr:outer membrane protein transport protein [Fulvivirgaceae bacterium BMA10]
MEKLKVILVGICIVFSTNTYATDGFFSHGYGTHYKGFAGAGVALYRSSLIAATNPAGLVFLGKRYDVGLSFFMPTRGYTITGNPSGAPGTFPLTPGYVESENSLFLVPTLGANWMLNEESSISAVIYANGGLNTEYATKTYDNPLAPVTAPTGVDLALVFSAISYSRKLSDNHSIGISAVLAYQRFQATGLQAFAGFSNDPTALSDNGYDNAFGYGLRIGYFGQINEALSIGASYQTKVQMSEFDKYAGLFAENGNFDVPSNFTVGLAYKVSPRVTLLGDFKMIMYESVNSVGNPLNLATLSPITPTGDPNPLFKPLGDENSQGFGWQNMNIYKVAAEFNASNDWTFRGGYSYGKQPIAESEVLFNILAPGVIESHASLGFTKKLGNRELTMAATYAFNKEVEGPNPLDPAQTIKLEMKQFDLDIAISF